MGKSGKSNKSGFTKKNDASVKPKSSNMPKASAEQLDLAKMLRSTSDDGDYKHKLQQIQECTACDLEKAVSALHDANNDVHRAIENILDPKYDNDWHDTVTKKSKSKRNADQKPKGFAASADLKESSTSSLNGHDVANVVDQVLQKPTKAVNARKGSKPIGRVKNVIIPLSGPDTSKKTFQTDRIHIEGWGIECGEWKGEAIEIVNSAANVPINIHDDTELLKLLTSDSVETASERCDEEKDQRKAGENSQSVDLGSEALPNSTTEHIKAIKERLFSKYARSEDPPSSHVPDVPVFFAPGSKNSAVSAASAPEPVVVQTYLQEQNSYSDARPHHRAPIVDPDIVHERRSVSNEQNVNPQDRITSPNQCNYSPVMNTLLQPVPGMQQNLQADQIYPPPLQNATSHKETYAKIQDHVPSQGRAQTPSVNNFDNPKAYNYNMLGELSQNMKQVSLETQVGKSDAFTQSISSTQPDGVVPVSYSMQPTKQTVSQPPAINKSISSMPLNATQQSLPTTQPQMHPVMHPALPPLLSHFQPNMSLFNFASGSGPTPAPHLFDMDQFQALQQQQQRMLFELQQSQHSQTVANENSLSNASDVISSNKTGVPMHQVTTANVSSGITFLPYNGGMVLMNSIPNTYLGPQHSQANGSQTQSSGHGGSPLSHQSSQPQYPKAMNSTPNYAAYQGIKQTNFDEVGDLFYQTLAKQVAYKHAGSGVQGFYNPPLQQPSKPGGGPDLSLGGKIQQQTPGLQSAQQTPPLQQPQAPNAVLGVQPQALYSQQAPNQYPLYQQHCMTMAAAVAAAQSQQPSHVAPSSGTPGPGGMVPMHGRPTH